MDQSIRPITSGDLFAPRNDEAASVVGLTQGADAVAPFLEQLEAAGAKPLPLPPQFVLAMQDVIGEDGVTTIEIAGVQRPEHFDHTSPCHVVGTWIHTHLPEIIDAARSATQVQPSALRLPDGSLIGAR